MDSLPLVNATLNALSALLLVVGFSFIKKKKIDWHRRCMKLAFVVSMLFLVGYLLHKVHLHDTTGSYTTQFTGEGAIRPVYYSLLISHVFLAMMVPFLASITLFRGLKLQVEKHRKIARVTFPIWLYVSITGVLVYFMLYQWYPVS
ncbi:MAG: DUF420 domain-containing protein [Ignavibacteria bacterium]|nr:DUF420 domain-containing protein [Ignavibacteria bacterium]